MADDVSRSGRVRKKSSKLTDYQDPEDVDKKMNTSLGEPSSAPPDQLLTSEDDLETDTEHNNTDNRSDDTLINQCIFRIH